MLLVLVELSAVAADRTPAHTEGHTLENGACACSVLQTLPISPMLFQSLLNVFLLFWSVFECCSIPVLYRDSQRPEGFETTSNPGRISLVVVLLVHIY